MPQLIDCPACARAIRRDEGACPFCGAEQRRTESQGLLVFGVLLGVMTASCGKPEPDPTATTTLTTTTSTSTTSTSTGTTSPTTTAPTSTNTGTTDGTTASSGTSDDTTFGSVATAYAAALDGESAGAPPPLTEGDPGEGDSTGE